MIHKQVLKTADIQFQNAQYIYDNWYPVYIEDNTTEERDYEQEIEDNQEF